MNSVYVFIVAVVDIEEQLFMQALEKSRLRM